MTTLGFIGGTGPEGKGLAARFARAGYEIVIGSRSAERGAEAANEVAALARGNLSGGTNADAAAADIVIVTIPYAGLHDTLVNLVDTIGERIVVSAVVPLKFGGGKVTMLDLEDGSAAEEMQRLLPRARVVGAFQNLSAHKLLDVDHAIEGDVLVCADDKDALAEVIELSNCIEGLRGVNAGALYVSRYIEAVTALLVNVNRVHKTESAIQIVGV